MIAVSLKVELLYDKAKLHELVILAFQDIEEFVPPYLPPPSSTSAIPNKSTVNPPYIRAVLSLVESCQQLVSVVAGATSGELRSCPTITFVRCLYTIKILTLLARALLDPESPVSKVIDNDTLRLNHYSCILIRSLEAAAGEQRCKVPGMIAKVVQRISSGQEESQSALHREQPSCNSVVPDQTLGFASSLENAKQHNSRPELNDLDLPITPEQSFEHRPNFEMGEAWGINPVGWENSSDDLMAYPSDFEAMFATLPFTSQPTGEGFSFNGFNFASG